MQACGVGPGVWGLTAAFARLGAALRSTVIIEKETELGGLQRTQVGDSSTLHEGFTCTLIFFQGRTRTSGDAPRQVGLGGELTTN